MVVVVVAEAAVVVVGVVVRVGVDADMLLEALNFVVAVGDFVQVLFRFRVCLQLCIAGLVPVWRLATRKDHGWVFKRSPRFTNGVYREAGLFLRALFTEGCEPCDGS